jgi:hypothetical protein
MSMKLTVGICLALIVLLAPEHRQYLRELWHGDSRDSSEAMTLDQWHAKAVANDELIQWLRCEMEEALTEQERLFREQPSTTVDDAAAQSETR